MICKDNRHNLIVIYWHSRAFNEEPTVRWCTDCGAVVVDIDSDGRIAPGAIRRMELPHETNR